MTENRTILKQCHMSTSGGPGLSTYLESWLLEKLDTYLINLDDYDHTKVSHRQAILSDKYDSGSNKKAYLIIIHLWDDISHNILSSRYDLFNIKGREIWLVDLISDNSSIGYVIEIFPQFQEVRREIKMNVLLLHQIAAILGVVRKITRDG